MYLEELAEADTEIGDSGAPLIPPKDFDMDKFNRGKKFLQNHAFSCVLSMLISLLCGLSVKRLLDPLVFTEQSNTPQKSFNRYGTTFVHVARWYYGNIWDKDNLAYKSIMAVRNMHNKVRKNLMEHESNVNAQDRNDSGVNSRTSQNMRLSQYDMSLVQSGFFGSVITSPKVIGIRCTEEDLEDLVYFWYGIGYALGISDKNNICIHGYRVTKEICMEIEQGVLLPAMRDPPKDFHKMAKALTDGLNDINRIPLYSTEAITAFGYKGMGARIPPMSFINTCRYLYGLLMIFLIYYCPFFEKIFSALYRFVFWQSGIMTKKA